MIIALGIAAAVIAVALLKKYHTASAATAAVKAEVAKIEAEVVAAEPAIKAVALPIIARLKSLL